tara:strand:- start:19 stop:330 length:312 start_codon:yes stop_codon:yes gene_type:complete
MKINWLVKYYFLCFIIIFSLFYFIESSEPYVNWSLYPNVSETNIKDLIVNNKCEELKALYTNEYNSKYETNFLGYNKRKDKKSFRGLNLLKYLKYHIKNIKCS